MSNHRDGEPLEDGSGFYFAGGIVRTNGCGKQLWVADTEGYIPVCGKDGHLCEDCKQEANPKSI